MMDDEFERAKYVCYFQSVLVALITMIVTGVDIKILQV